MAGNDASSIQHRKAHGQYYTEAYFGSLLVDRFCDEAIKTAVELGVGQGALLSAVTCRWPNVRYISVDIDPNHQQYTREGNSIHAHYCADALEIELSSIIGIAPEQADLVVCNPPFVTPKWRPAFETILQRVGFPTPNAALTIGADILFLAQNLWILKKSGQLGIIVPDSLVSGAKNRKLREILVSQHCVKEVIELPPKAFSGAEVKTYIIKLKKEHAADPNITLLRCNEDGALDKPIYISTAEGSARLDYSHYAFKSSKAYALLKQFEPDSTLRVLRGSISMSKAKKNSLKILHTTDLRQDLDLENLDISTDFLPPPHCKEVIIRAGDVLIGRVGRNLERKIALVRSGKAIASDCIYVLRSDTHSGELLYKSLASPNGAQWLKAHMRGACVKFINKCDLLNFPLAPSI